MKLPLAWFLPTSHDVLGLLHAELDTVTGMVATVGDWARGGRAAGDAAAHLRQELTTVRGQRRTLHAAVRDSFSTPLEAEDIYALGERLGELAEACFCLVREADVSRTGPDAHLLRMVEQVIAVTAVIDRAVRALPDQRAASLADQANEQLGELEAGYQAAIAGLEDEPDIRHEVRLRQLYLRTEQLGRRCELIARRAWYAVCKSH